MADTTHLKITGMTCKHCVMNAKKAIEAVAGVDSVEVTLEPGGAVIVGSADKENLIAAVTTAGYEAELAN
ncbi:MAG: cation transporter [Gammaproteobacteria bacterium]|nr:cation transporter [Gammaproteobacteria bacterium]